MAKKVFENDGELDTLEEFDEEVKVGVYSPRVNQIVRKIGPMSVGDVTMIEEVDAVLSSHINEGWKLSFVERIASETDGHTILYVLTKD